MVRQYGDKLVSRKTERRLEKTSNSVEKIK